MQVTGEALETCRWARQPVIDAHNIQLETIPLPPVFQQILVETIQELHYRTINHEFQQLLLL
jgi:hypothetical protein